MRLINLFKSKFKNFWMLFVFTIVSVILWNTNNLFNSLRLEERNKMMLWAMAQEEYIKNPTLSNLTFEVLQRSGINPMIQVNENNKIIEIRNVKWDESRQDSIELYDILSKLKKENEPILIRYSDEKGNLLVNQKLLVLTSHHI